MDEAAIAEWQECEAPATDDREDHEFEMEYDNGPVDFRIAITTQVYENYGAHAWDGKGECPQYWKAKGGSEYQFVVGNAMTVVQLGSDKLQELVYEFAASVSKFDDCWDESMINWALVPSNEETYGERDIREMLEWGMVEPEMAERMRKDLVPSFTRTKTNNRS